MRRSVDRRLIKPDICQSHRCQDVVCTSMGSYVGVYERDTSKDRHLLDTGVPISHIPDFLPPNIPYPRFFTPNIPYPRFFTPQYPISQISQSIDHIPDFARLECVRIHSFEIQLVRMDPILLDIFIIAVNIHVHGHLRLHFNNVHHSNMYMGSH